jgi:gamma-glutamylcyclotransferase (GGCT)/AIG2-like uncharacterized protein YtfP
MANEPVATGDLFFFYGLLKQGACGSPQGLDLVGSGKFLGAARINGRMYDLGGFPGIVKGGPHEKGECHGVLYRLDHSGLAADMDAFEDILLHDHEASLYRREKVIAQTEIGPVSAWVYIYNQPVREASHVPNGDWPLEAGRTRK